MVLHNFIQHFSLFHKIITKVTYQWSFYVSTSQDGIYIHAMSKSDSPILYLFLQKYIKLYSDIVHLNKGKYFLNKKINKILNNDHCSLNN